MKKKYIYIFPILLVLYYGIRFAIHLGEPSDGEMAPDFESELVDGSSFRLSDLRGQYVLINFWASWCAPCRKENVELVALNKELGDDKLVIVSIALEKSSHAWKNAVEKDGVTWKHQIVKKHKLVLFSDLARLYGVSEIPAKFLVSPDGRILPEMSFEEMEKLLQ